MSAEPSGAEPDPSNKFVRFGGWSTAIYLTAALAYALSVRENVMRLTPDEFATFVAGAFSPLAFLWLVLGFFQQGQELRQSSKALWLQGEELRNSVEQQRSLVEVSRQQLDFERERIESEHAYTKRRAQPDFVFTGGGYSTAGERTLMNFRMLNRGNRCTDVRLHVSDGHIVRLPILESGRDTEFNIDVGPEHPLGDRAFKVEYVDMLGELGEDILILHAFVSGDRMLLRMPD